MFGHCDLAALVQPHLIFPFVCLLAVGWLARIGSGLFLVIQMIILLDFTQSWNDAWVANGEEDERWLYALLAITITAFGGVLAIAGAGGLAVGVWFGGTF